MGMKKANTVYRITPGVGFDVQRFFREQWNVCSCRNDPDMCVDCKAALMRELEPLLGPCPHFMTDTLGACAACGKDLSHEA